MKIKYLGTFGMGGHSKTKFLSGRTIYEMGTYFAQIPDKIRGSKDEFEIPDDFLKKELGLLEKQNPLKWFCNEKKKLEKDLEKNCERNNELFRKFMDVVAKFCNYDRKGKMAAQEEWANRHSM
jgi:hypothetical protein